MVTIEKEASIVSHIGLVLNTGEAFIWTKL